jgi:uncharacterized protein YcaQ
VRSLTIPQARRIALAAQGFAEPRPRGRIDARHLRRVVDRVGVVQLDSVNVVARAHYLPFFARLGNYPMELADWLGWKSGEMVEYWAHEAALFPVERWPLFRHRMERNWHWPSMDRWMSENGETMAEVLAEVRKRGPLRPADLDNHANAVRGPWWDWSDAKLALEALFFTGQLTIRDRDNFIRRYDLPERVLPPEVVRRRVDHDESLRELLALAVRHHGVGTVPDLADYYRLKPQVAAPLLSGLAATGAIEEVQVKGWKGPVYADPEARLPRAVRGLALLCPFDPVVWFRPRAERLFDFHYRIEIYVPAPKRQFGYYVWPFLLDGRLVGRVDLKAERTRNALHAVGVFAEPGQDKSRVAEALATELRSMAGWLGLSDVTVGKKGDLTAPLSRALG